MEIGERMEGDGFVVVPDVLTAAEAAALGALLDSALRPPTKEAAAGYRNVLSLAPAVRDWIETPAIRGLAEAVIGPGAFPVRVILFDKTPAANWRVPWHQDLSIAVRERPASVTPDWGPWSEKEGVPHVQPPIPVLERMVTTRLHLDDCGAGNGPLRVLPGTHALGRLNAHRIQAEHRERIEVACTCETGGVILMRPLLLHASSPARVPGRRRVLHVEWAAEALPVGIEWAETSQALAAAR